MCTTALLVLLVVPPLTDRRRLGLIRGSGCWDRLGGSADLEGPGLGLRGFIRGGAFPEVSCRKVDGGRDRFTGWTSVTTANWSALDSK